MSGHYNDLTPGEQERLVLLLEEMGEAQQAIGKILRHGYESRHPQGGESNREMLERELGDVRHCMIRLCNAGDLSKKAVHAHADAKAESVVEYLHHQS